MVRSTSKQLGITCGDSFWGDESDGYNLGGRACLNPPRIPAELIGTPVVRPDI
jgi:hypothetical protein